MSWFGRPEISDEVRASLTEDPNKAKREKLHADVKQRGGRALAEMFIEMHVPGESAFAKELNSRAMLDLFRMMSESEQANFIYQFLLMIYAQKDE